MPSMMYGHPRNTMGRGRDYRMGRDSRTSYPRMDSRRTRMDRMSRGMDRTHYPEYDSRYDYESSDMANRQSMDRNYDMDYARNVNYSGRYGNVPFQLNSMEDYGMDYARGGRRDYRGGRDYNMDYGYDYNYDYRYDYSMGNKLDEREIEDWTHELLEHVDDKDREMLKKEKILKRAEEMGIKFDQFTKDEFYLVVVMEYTDHCKTFGSANIDTYIRMAKDWLMDDDVKVKHGEKLAAYYDYIVKGY